MNSLETAQHREQVRSEYQRIADKAKVSRNFNINRAFEDGFRQKEIATVTGLSESTVKHIIARMKKNEQ